MEIDQDTISWAVGIISVLGTLVLGYKQLAKSALDQQTKFQNNLMTRLEQQDNVIATLEKKINAVRKELSATKRHHEKCERELAALKLAVG